MVLVGPRRMSKSCQTYSIPSFILLFPSILRDLTPILNCMNRSSWSRNLKQTLIFDGNSNQHVNALTFREYLESWKTA